MSSFTSPLVLSPIDGTWWELQEEFRYRVGGMDSTNIITVPVGFKTNFASVPRIFWALISPWGKHGKASVIHDYLYNTGLRSRKEADELFLEGMEVLRVNIIKRRFMYLMVRTFGWLHYKAK